jgi:phosphodiesterase/alkaline phosphatase D-like protein
MEKRGILRRFRAAVLGSLVAGSVTGPAVLAQTAHHAAEWNAPTPYPDRIVLTWSKDPARSQSITWRTDTTVHNAAVEFALASPGPGFDHSAQRVEAAGATLDARVVEGQNVIARYHSVTLSGLTPDTIYAYRVGDGVRWSEWFHFRTASLTPKPFSFIYLGDAQNDILSLWSRTLRNSYLTAPDARFMIHAGDLINTAHNDLQWGEWFRAGGWMHAMVPSVPAPGNHEYRAYSNVEGDSSRLSLFWKPQFTLPENGVKGLEESNYFIDYQGVRVVVLNSNRERAAQAAWLDRVLSDNPNKWTVLTFHHPIFSAARERDNAELRALWKPVLDKYRVDLVLQGHDHTYARGRARNEGSGVNVRDGTVGTIYVVSVSGPKMYEFSTKAWDPYPADLDRRAENTQLFQVIRVKGDTIEYRAHTATGVLYDAFGLIRTKKGNRFIERMPPGTPSRTFRDGPPYPYRAREGG